VERARSARVWAAIAACAQREGSAVSVQHAVTACADALAAAGAGLSINRDDASREPVLASAPAAEELEELQFTLGQGPGIDAVAGRGPVLVADLAAPEARHRWPLFAVSAAERGVRGMFAFPVAAGAATIGVLGVYRLQAGPLNAEELADGLTFADMLLALALDERSGIVTPPGSLAGHHDVTRRAQVHQATGMVAAQLDVSMSDALAALRARAYVTGQRLSDLAADVLARRVRLDPQPRRDEEESG
jgi:GAF domain-containing protein/ANTAR domain-containing protein/AAA lid domain-containing protein